MARVRSVKKFTQPGHTPRRFNVDLTEGEVDFLIGSLTRVSGNPATSPRKYADRIASVLIAAAGYGWDESDANALAEGEITFSHYKPRGRKTAPDDERFRDFGEFVRRYVRAVAATALLR